MDTKQKIINKLRELGISSSNCYPKKSFIHQLNPVVALFENELTEDFYFFTTYHNKLFKFPKQENMKGFATENYQGSDKWLIPVSDCEVVWEDKPYEELPNLAFDKMTLRDYASIHLKVPESEHEWLNTIIKKSS